MATSSSSTVDAEKQADPYGSDYPFDILRIPNPEQSR